MRRRAQRRLQKESGHRKALLFILFCDCTARAYYDMTEGEQER